MPEMNITISENKKDFEGFVKDLGLAEPEKYIHRKVLIVPNIGYLDKSDLVYFPSETDDLYEFLREKQNDEFDVDIYITDDNYKELALHADWIRIADILVRDVTAPLLIGLLIEYISQRMRNKEDSKVKTKITVVSEKDRRAVTISYEGSAKEFGKVMNAQITNLAHNKQQRMPTGRNKKHRAK